jgi:hypothetical protein
VVSSQRSCGCEAKDGRFDGVRCGAVEVEPNYPSLVVIFLFAHMGILVFSFPINSTQGLVERIKHSTIPLPPLAIAAF